MPVRKVGNKWRVGKGKALYKTKKAAQRVQRAIYAKKNKKR